MSGLYSLRSKRFRASSSRKLGREQKKGVTALAITRLETLATQSTVYMTGPTIKFHDVSLN